MPKLPPALDALIAKGLARDRAARFATAWDMAEAAQRVAFATTGEVSAWVRTCGGAPMAARAELVATMESRAARKALAREAEVRVEPRDMAPAGRAAAKEVSSVPPPAKAAGDVVPSTRATSPALTVPPLPVTLLTPPPALPEAAPAARLTPRAEPPAPSPDDFEGAPPTSVSGATASNPWRTDARRRKGPLVLAGGGVVALVVGLVVLWPSPPLDAPAADAGPRPSVSAPPVTAAASVPPPEPSASASMSAPRLASPPRPPGPNAGGVHPAPPAPAPRAHCNPPYTVNADGIRIPKLNCL